MSTRMNLALKIAGAVCLALLAYYALTWKVTIIN